MIVAMLEVTGVALLVLAGAGLFAGLVEWYWRRQDARRERESRRRGS